MKPELFQPLRRSAASIAVILGLASTAYADGHGIAMYGDPALPPDFAHLPYANPDAPHGGWIGTSNVGSFDSLNPYILKGSVPWQMRFLLGESLMGRSLDEPFSLYGLLAEKIETGPNREWVEFTLREEARFTDGTPVTVEDVIWSFETLGTVGHPRYHGFYNKIASIEETGDRMVRFTFNEADRELALLAGLRPILKKAQWDGVDFAESGTDIVPITSSPYEITDFEAGRFIVMTRVEDYWGADVPFRVGTANLDEIRLEFFGDETAAFEAFKVGEVNSNREFNVARWESQYDFPAVQEGDVVLSVLPHERPSGMTGFVMNTRLPQFEDWRVRDALMHAFNFEFVNEAMTGSAQPRITSYWSNSPLGMSHDAAEGRVAEFLEPFADDLIPGTIEGYSLPESDGSERNRAGTAVALDQMAAAGWNVGADGVMRNADGEEFTFEILLQTGASEPQSMIDMYTESLGRIGITPTVINVDSAQFKERTDAYDFGMTYYRRGVSLSPGNEQYAYYGMDAADEVGSRNLMGVQSEAVDAMIGRLLTSENQDDFVAAVKALDRILTAGRYVIPIYQWNISRVAHSDNLNYPDTMPIFGDWPGWQPDVWWWEE
ncbi:extracellular solute-binding protein [Yoonia sp. 208BN28-4]|uniref:extracellular solute-binding protein n=1 Tax=Yoonia sp. 208BN28-4 TaxID=3126505 RepID=UPI0030999A86